MSYSRAQNTYVITDTPFNVLTTLFFQRFNDTIHLRVNRGSTGSIPGQSTWDVWWPAWQWNGLFSEYFLLIPSVSHTGAPCFLLCHRRHTILSVASVVKLFRNLRRHNSQTHRQNVSRKSKGKGSRPVTGREGPDG